MVPDNICGCGDNTLEGALRYDECGVCDGSDSSSNQSDSKDTNPYRGTMNSKLQKTSNDGSRETKFTVQGKSHKLIDGGRRVNLSKVIREWMNEVYRK